MLSNKIDNLIEEATRFAKELSQQKPFSKKVSMLLKQASLDNVQYGSKPGFVPRNSDIALGSQVKAFNDGNIGNKTDFINRLQKNVRLSGQDNRDNNIPFKPKNNLSNQNYKNTGVGNIEHGGGKYFLKGLLSGNKNYSKAVDAQMGTSGIWVHPDNTKLNPTRTSFYASSAYNYGDIPAKLTGKIPLNNLEKTPNGYEAFLSQKNAVKNRNSLKIEKINHQQADKAGRFSGLIEQLLINSKAIF